MCPHTINAGHHSHGLIFTVCVHTLKTHSLPNVSTQQEMIMTSPEKILKTYAIRFSDSEVADIQDMTKVDAVAPAVRSIVLKEIEKAKAPTAK